MIMKTTMQLINYIARNNFEIIIIGGNDDMTPMQAVEHLSGLPPYDVLNFSSTILKGQLHIW
jgi:hypothetical protein